MEDNQYISDFEDLIKLREFSKKPELKMAFDCTLELISKTLINEYSENINEKIMRWIEVTHVMYLKEAKVVKYYFQAKMLYRDGFYESSIALSRSICEMICYDLVDRFTHPFGNIEKFDVPMFRVLLNFIVIPKKIPKTRFINNVTNKITCMEDLNFIKSAYSFDKSKEVYLFKNECGKNNKNLEKFIEIFRNIGFHDFDNLKIETHQFLHEIYNLGNKYIHAKTINSHPVNDSKECLNKLAHVLCEAYGLKTDIIGKTIKSGYLDFPDICSGMNYAISYADSPEAAVRDYYNLPSQKQILNLLECVGTWAGEWKDKNNNRQIGILNFFYEGKDYLCAKINYFDSNNDAKEEHFEIRIFGNYFHLIGFDSNDMIHRKNVNFHFEMELFNVDTIIGMSIDGTGKILFKRL